MFQLCRKSYYCGTEHKMLLSKYSLSHLELMTMRNRTKKPWPRGFLTPCPLHVMKKC